MSRREFLERWASRSGHRSRCFYCGREMTKRIPGKYSPFQVSNEHLFPASNHPRMQWNIVQACCGCNVAKGCSSIEEFRAWRGGTQFYCEAIVGERFPSDERSRAGDGKIRSYLVEMVDDCFNRLRSDIGRQFHSRDLTKRLDRIISEAKGKVARNETARNY